LTGYSTPGEGGAIPFFANLRTEPLESTADAARFYLSHGVGVVPNARGRKSPTVMGWPDLRLGVEDVPRHFDNGQNVGLLLGEASGGLVDVDVDCAEARTIADQFLVDTLASGRKGTPRSHRFFVSPGAKTRSWRMPGKDGTMIIELRSTGAQTLVEPSVHPTGEHYEWDRDGVLEAVEISTEELELACRGIATAAAIARHLPAGGRHDFAMALAGYLLRPGRLDEAVTLEILLAAWHAAGADSREALDDVERIVRDTARKASSGGQVTGGPTLDEQAPGLVPLLAGWWGWRSGEATSAGVDSASGERPTEDELRDRWIESRECPTAYGQSEWRRYQGGYWAPVYQEVINLEIDGVLEDAKIEGIRPTAGMRSSVEKLARAKTFVDDEVWDANVDILVCQNGTLEISSGILREHRPEDYALGAVPYDFNPEATPQPSTSASCPQSPRLRPSYRSSSGSR
jgi:putative DNA primase/helicase